MKDRKMFTGGCLCEGVRYRVNGEMSDITLCHCSQCARTSGHIFASANCAADALILEESRTLRWYRSSEKAERGFCSNCGGNLFWRKIDGDVVEVTAGTLDLPTGLRFKHHIYCDSRSDYDEIQDQLPRYAAEAEAGSQSGRATFSLFASHEVSILRSEHDPRLVRQLEPRR